MRGVRHVLAVAIVALAAPAAAAPMAETPARAFVLAITDRAYIEQVTRAAMADKLAQCVARGFVSAEVMAARKPLLDRYLDLFFAGLDEVEATAATQAAAMLSAADLRAAARFYGSPVYVAMRRKAAPAMTDPVVMAMPGCGNVPRRLDVADMGARGMRLLTAQEKAQVAAFTFSPAGQHLVRVAPQLMAAVQASYRQVAIRAAHDSGLVPAPLPAAAPPSPESLDLGPIRP